MAEPIPSGDQNSRDEGAGRDLLARVATGDREAFQLFYTRYAKRVLAMVRRKVSELQVAEELVQDVFVAVWLSAPSYRPGLGDPGVWLAGIVQHKLSDHWRRLGRIADAVGIRLADRAGARTAPPEMRLALEQALLGLTPEQRAVIDLIYLYGLTFTEAARSLRIPAGTVKSRVSAALSTMRAFLAPGGRR